MSYIISKYKSVRNIIVLTAVGIGSAISCSRDLLDKKPLDSISEEAVFTDATFLQNYVYNISLTMRK